MELSGIDIQKYSTRSASSSKAKSMGMLLKNITKCGGSKSDKTFTQHLHKQVQKELDICFQLDM